MTRLIAMTSLVLGLTCYTPMARACHENPTCTVYGVSGAQICDRCFGTLDCPTDGADFNPVRNDICPGHCFKSPNAVCTEHSDCTNGGDDFCNFTGDGKVTYCYGDDANVVAATITDQIICTNGGNDIVLHVYNVPYKINLGAGDDTLVTGSNINTSDNIEGGTGNDTIYGGQGNDNIFGNTATTYTGDGDNLLVGDAGNDLIYGGDGDDIIYGKDGADLIAGQGGRDVMKGGEGNDQLYTASGTTPANDVLGSILCGDAGYDLLYANGPGHQCLNGGSGQTTSGDCYYTNTPADSDAHDVGTARNCNTVTGSASVGKIGCGCEGEDQGL